EVAARARRIGAAPIAQLFSWDVGDEHDVGERVLAGAERLARRVALSGPLALRRRARAPLRPDVVELQRIGVDDDEAVAVLELQYLSPPGDVALDPEARSHLDVRRNGRVIGKRLEQRARATVTHAPRRFS